MRKGLAVVMVCAACGDEPYDGLLEPPPSDRGMQLSVKVPVMPGQEMTICKNFPIPSGSFDIGRFEHAMTPVSHHLLVYPLLLASTLVTDEIIYDCDERPEAQGTRIGILFGTQSATSDLSLPDGIAYGAMGGLAVQVEFHILNTGDEPVDAEVALNLWRTSGEITGEAGNVFFYNDRILIPPMSTASARQRCSFPLDLQLLNLTPHMHSRGVAMQIFKDTGDGTPELLVDAQGFGEDTVQFDPPISLAPGEVLDVRCDYNNTTSEYIDEGGSARSNEMCVTGGLYYRQGERLGVRDEMCWGRGIVYSGTQTCRQVDACLHTLDGTMTNPTIHEQFLMCANSACQSAADAWAPFDACRWNSCNADCYLREGEAVTGLKFDAAECVSCLDTMCGALRDSCDSATCP